MSQITRLNFANFFFHFARMFSGAIFVIVLMELGISLKTIALAKGFQLVISSLLVVPCGVISDKYGGKTAVIAACFFSLIYYFFLIHPTDFKVILGEVCNGVALALYTGAFESWIFSLANGKNAIQLHTHLARARELSYIAIICGGLIGAWMSSQVFLLSLIFMLASCGLFFFVKNCRHSVDGVKERYFLPSLRTLIDKKIGIFLLASSFLIGGGMQLIYQFWQPFFLKFIPKDDSRGTFGYIFVAFMLTQYVISRAVRKKFVQKTRHVLPAVGILWIVSGLLLLSTLKTNNFYLACSCFCIFLGLATAVANLLTAYLGEFIEQKFQSTAISILDLAGKSLGTCFLFFGESVFTLSNFDYGWQFLSISLLIMAIWVLTQRSRLCIVETA